MIISSSKVGLVEFYKLGLYNKKSKYLWSIFYAVHGILRSRPNNCNATHLKTNPLVLSCPASLLIMQLLIRESYSQVVSLGSSFVSPSIKSARRPVLPKVEISFYLDTILFPCRQNRRTPCLWKPSSMVRRTLWGSQIFPEIHMIVLCPV